MNKVQLSAVMLTNSVILYSQKTTVETFCLVVFMMAVFGVNYFSQDKELNK